MSSAPLSVFRDLCRTVRRKSSKAGFNRRGRKSIRRRILLPEPLETRALLSVAGLPDTASISGFVYFDVNGNGGKDSVESGLPNVAVSIEGPFNTTAISGENGSYQFTDLPPGEYTLTQLPPLGITTGFATQGTPALGAAESARFVNVNLEAGAVATDYNFGEVGLEPDLISLQSLLAIRPTDLQVAPTIRVTDGYGRPVSIGKLINFGSAAKGAPAPQQTFSVYNPSTTDTLDLSNVRLNPNPTASFRAAPWSHTSIPPMSSASFTVSMPTDMSPGNRQSPLTFYYAKHGQQSYPYTFGLNGQLTASQFVVGQGGVSVTDCFTADDVDGTTIDIGTAVQGTAGPEKTYCINNHGENPVSLGPLSVQPNFAFLASSLPSTLPPRSSSVFTVQLATNTSPGTKQARFDFAYTVQGQGQEYDYGFDVTGQVTPTDNPIVLPFTVTVDGTSTDIQGATIGLGNSSPGGEYPRRTFRISNNTDQTVDLSSLSKSGSDAVYASNFPNQVPPQDSVLFDVALTTDASPGQYPAMYTFRYDDTLYGFSVSGNVTEDLPPDAWPNIFLASCQQPQQDIRGRSINLGTTPINTAGTPKAFCIYNRDPNNTVTVSAPASSSATDFAVATSPGWSNPLSYSVSPNRFTVGLAPNASTGYKSALISFLVNGSYTYYFYATGRVTAAIGTLDAVPSIGLVSCGTSADIRGRSINLGSTPINTAGIPKEFCIYNRDPNNTVTVSAPTSSSVTNFRVSKSPSWSDQLSYSASPNRFTVGLAPNDSAGYKSALISFLVNGSYTYYFYVTGTVTINLGTTGTMGSAPSIGLVDCGTQADVRGRNVALGSTRVNTPGTPKTFCIYNQDPNNTVNIGAPISSSTKDFRVATSSGWSNPLSYNASPNRFTVWLAPNVSTGPKSAMISFLVNGSYTYYFYATGTVTAAASLEASPPTPPGGESANGEPNVSVLSPVFLDANRNGSVTPADVLEVINYLNVQGPDPATGKLEQAAADVNRDGWVTPLDVLSVVNFLNVHGPCAVSSTGDLAVPSDWVGTAAGEAGPASPAPAFNGTSLGFVPPIPAGALAALSATAADPTLQIPFSAPYGSAGAAGQPDDLVPVQTIDRSLERSAAELLPDLDFVLSDIAADIDQAWAGDPTSIR